MSKKNNVLKEVLANILKAIKNVVGRLATFIVAALILALLLFSLIASADESQVVEVKTKKSAVTTAKFNNRYKCSIEYLGKNIFITATHCIQHIFERKYGNLNPIQINNAYGLFKVLYYSMDQGVALTDGFALFEVYMLDFSSYETLEIASKYVNPTHLHCYPALRTGLIVEVKSKLKNPTRLIPSRVVAVGSVGPGCSGGAWLSDDNQLIAVTSAGWGSTGVSTAVVLTDHHSLITNVLNGARPEIMTWEQAKKIFRPGELKRRRGYENIDEVPAQFDCKDKDKKDPKDKDKKKPKKKNRKHIDVIRPYVQGA